MNRKERRGAARKGVTDKDLKNIIEHNTVSGYEEGYRAGFKEGSAAIVETAVESFSVAILYVMHNKLHYGAKKSQITMNQIAEVFRQFYTHELDMDMIKKELQEQTGVTLVGGPEQP